MKYLTNILMMHDEILKLKKKIDYNEELINYNKKR